MSALPCSLQHYSTIAELWKQTKHTEKTGAEGGAGKKNEENMYVWDTQFLIKLNY